MSSLSVTSALLFTQVPKDIVKVWTGVEGDSTNRPPLKKLTVHLELNENPGSMRITEEGAQGNHWKLSLKFWESLEAHITTFCQENTDFWVPHGGQAPEDGPPFSVETNRRPDTKPVSLSSNQSTRGGQDRTLPPPRNRHRLTARYPSEDTYQGYYDPRYQY